MSYIISTFIVFDIRTEFFIPFLVCLLVMILGFYFLVIIFASQNLNKLLVHEYELKLLKEKLGKSIII